MTLRDGKNRFPLRIMMAANARADRVKRMEDVIDLMCQIGLQERPRNKRTPYAIMCRSEKLKTRYSG